MSIAAILPLLFALIALVSLAVLAQSGRRFFGAWGELKQALETFDGSCKARIGVIETGYRPVRLELVEGAAPPMAAECLPGLREAA